MVSEPGHFDDPGAIEAASLDGGLTGLLAWSPMTLPCTAASALRGRLGTAQPARALDELDLWLRRSFDAPAGSERGVELVCHGLATRTELWLNEDRLCEVDNMFLRTAVDVSSALRASNTLWICFRALGPLLRRRGPRGRWRTRLTPERNLRLVRTTLLGRMPSWMPDQPVVGPWRDVELCVRSPIEIQVDSLATRVDGDLGTVDIDLSLSIDPAAVESGSGTPAASLRMGKTLHPLEVRRGSRNRWRLEGRALIEDVERWWPHSHGAQPLYPMELRVDLAGREERLDLGSIGFREIELASSEDGEFGIRVNGVKVFCRGACWSPLDAESLDTTPTRLRSALEELREAGANMIRVSGPMVYESDLFYQLCDELGLMIWQDFMFATLDYDSDDALFNESIQREAQQFLDRTRQRVCLTVVCGSSEGQQQPAMLGLGEETWTSPLFDSMLPALVAQIRPDLPYRASTPSGGALPFHVHHGTSHYFGVGAYRRPLSDAVLARPRFMTECLAFSHLPDARGIARIRAAMALGSGSDGDPERLRAPRDSGADWDFADVTDHYTGVLFGVDAAELRSQAPDHHARLSRATSADLVQRMQGVWRRPTSGCGGALVWLYRDPWPCAGWGFIDADGRRKSAYFGLKRAWQPICLAIVDDGLNGLTLIVHNDRPQSIDGDVTIRLMRFDGQEVVGEKHRIVMDSRSSREYSIDRLLGGFVDSSQAYGFGPRAFDLCVAQLVHATEEENPSHDSVETIHLVDEAVLLDREPIGLDANWIDSTPGTAVLEIRVDRFARTVEIEADGGVLSDNYFHVAPGSRRRIEIRAIAGEAIGAVQIGALNATDRCRLDAPGVEPGPRMQA